MVKLCHKIQINVISLVNWVSFGQYFQVVFRDETQALNSALEGALYEENVNLYWNFAKGTTAKAQGTTAIAAILVLCVIPANAISKMAAMAKEHAVCC